MEGSGSKRGRHYSDVRTVVEKVVHRQGPQKSVTFSVQQLFRHEKKKMLQTNNTDPYVSVSKHTLGQELHNMNSTQKEANANTRAQNDDYNGRNSKRTLQCRIEKL